MKDKKVRSWFETSPGKLKVEERRSSIEEEVIFVNEHKKSWGELAVYSSYWKLEVVMRDGEFHLLQGIKHGMNDLLTRILLMTLALDMQ